MTRCETDSLNIIIFIRITLLCASLFSSSFTVLTSNSLSHLPFLSDAFSLYFTLCKSWLVKHLPSCLPYISNFTCDGCTLTFSVNRVCKLIDLVPSDAVWDNT